MKVLIIVAALAVACNAMSPAALSQGFQGVDTTKWGEFKCRDGLLGPSDANMAEIGACPQNDCAFYCQAKALGLLKPDMTTSSAIYDKWVQNVIPQRHQAISTTWFRDCFEKYGKYMDKSDKTCKFAKLFLDCTWSVQPNLTCPK